MCAGDHVTALSYQSSSDHLTKCSVSPPNDPSKNWTAADRPIAALGHTGVETCISVNCQLNAVRIASPPTMCMWTTNDDLCLCWQCRVATIIGGS